LETQNERLRISGKVQRLVPQKNESKTHRLPCGNTDAGKFEPVARYPFRQKLQKF